MTFTTDPPVVGDINLIPGQDEKADLNAPAGSGGKLVTGQVPNISISSTTVVADAAERLALDVQEGDVAIQSNTSESFIFTGGPNLAPNWQVIQFDAVGGIAGEDIAPNNINAQDVTASGDIDAASFANANLSGASAGELLGSDGSGNLQFTQPAGGGDEFINSASGIQVETVVRTQNNTNYNVFSFNDAKVYNLICSGPEFERKFGDNYAIIKFTDGTSLDTIRPGDYVANTVMNVGPLNNVTEIRFNTTINSTFRFTAYYEEN